METIWYMDAAGFSDLPDHVSGHGASVNIIDSCIDFSFYLLLLMGSSCSSFSVIQIYYESY